MATKKRGRGRPNAVEELVSSVDSQFQPIELLKPVSHSATAGAQERLTAALSSVNNVLLTMNLSRAVDRKLKKKELRGHLSESEVDILRAVIVFAGAGLDAALKKLIQDTVRDIAVRNPLARKKFLDFLDRHMAGTDTPVNRRLLAEVLIDGRGTQAALLDRYERDLTGDSLQSSEQVSVVCGALAIEDRTVRERLKSGALLDQMFKARNDIVHELDLTDTGRKPRNLKDVRAFAVEALEVTQEIINAVGRVLSQPAH